jgi:hypothetical protein
MIPKISRQLQFLSEEVSHYWIKDEIALTMVLMVVVREWIDKFPVSVLIPSRAAEFEFERE